jgi:hypothetical protein
MSLTGQSDTSVQTSRELVARNFPARLMAKPRWIVRHRAAIEATATMTLAMSAPILAAVSTLQTSA